MQSKIPSSALVLRSCEGFSLMKGDVPHVYVAAEALVLLLLPRSAHKEINCGLELNANSDEACLQCRGILF